MPRMPRELHINLHEITDGACRKLPGPCPHTVCRFNLTYAPYALLITCVATSSGAALCVTPPMPV